jgi:hypothetical protein
VKNIALSYAEKGYKVLPLAPNGKTPLTQHGVLDASDNPAIVHQWLKKWPTCNIGLAAGANSLHVLDVDTGLKNGRVCNGLEQLGELEAINGKLPLTLKQHTPSGGLHLIYRVTQELPGRKLASFIDTRGQGGYIAIAPSVVGGKPYQWEKHDIQPLPQWVASLLLTSPKPLIAPIQPLESSCYASLVNRPGFINGRVRAFLMSPDNKNEQDMTVFCALVGRGLCDEEITQLVNSYPMGQGIGRKDNPKRYLEISLYNARLRVKDVKPYVLTGVQHA